MARNRSNIVLIASLLFLLVGTGSIYFIVVALKQIANEFDWPRTVPSLAYALQYLGAGFGGIFMGWCLDKRGMGTPAFIGGSMVGLGAIATCFITTQWELFFIYGIMLGFLGRSTLFAPLTANITRWFENNKSLAVGIVGSGQGIAGMIWPPVFHQLISSIGWRQTALVYGVFSLITMLPLAFILRQKPPISSPQPAMHQSNNNQLSLQEAPQSNLRVQISLMIASIGCCVAMSLPLAHIVSHVSDLGYDPARGAEVLSVMLACSALASFFGVGYLGRKYGGLKALFIFSSGQATLLAGLALIESLPAVYVAAALFGLGYGGILPCYLVIVRELLPAAEAGRRTGLILLCAGFGMAIGSWLGGYIFDLTSSYQLAFIIGVVFNLGNLIIILNLIIVNGRKSKFLTQ